MTYNIGEDEEDQHKVCDEEERGGRADTIGLHHDVWKAEELAGGGGEGEGEGE